GALDRGVRGFGAAAGEDDLVRLAAKQRSHLGARAIHRLPRGNGRPVFARGIAEVFSEERQHRLLDLGRDRRARVVVEIDLAAHPRSISTVLSYRAMRRKTKAL